MIVPDVEVFEAILAGPLIRATESVSGLQGS